MISSYGNIYALGHKAVADIFDGPVEITEKFDGSQISASVIEGELLIRSKNQDLIGSLGNNMFHLAVEKITQQSHLFTPGYVYRGEYLRVPKHNTLAYERCPLNNIIIYDIERRPGSEDYLLWEERGIEAQRIGFEAVPVFHRSVWNLESIKDLLQTESVLGGVNIEGVVIKRYDFFTPEKRVAKAKYVSTEFQEKHQKEWKVSNPGRKEIVEDIIDSLRTDARWRKAVQHLRDDGRLEGSPRDIGNLIKETQNDILMEEEDFIKDILYNHFRSQILRGVVRGLPEKYKEWIAEGS